jgi:carotenoid cleavage dioxygenase
MNPQGGPPLPGGPVGFAFNALLQIEPGNGRIDMMGLDFGMAISEPVHVPSTQAGHEGWLMMVVDQQVGEGDFKSALWVVDAGAIAAGPIARVPMPLPMRAQVHGSWVSAAQLARRKGKRHDDRLTSA